MPNQWARSHRLQCQPDKRTQLTVNVKSIDTILYLVRLDAEQITHSLHSKQSIFQLMSI